jgi:hypothetical protein
MSLRGLSGRISVPVRRLSTPYAQFKHIKGVPVTAGGLPVFKLKILDGLIDQLLSYRGRISGLPDIEQLKPSGLDHLIGSLQQQLRQTMAASPPPFGGAYPQTGMLVDILV